MGKRTDIPLLEQRPPATPSALSPGDLRRLAQAPSATTPPPSRPPARSLYIHIPFCAHKCHYCDFYSIVDTRDRQAAFSDRLARELAAWAPLAAGAPLRTIFVGGGTPSLLRVDLWGAVLSALDRYYDLSDVRDGAGEFTVECNPESVTPELLGALAAAGVNRISMGAQSFNPAHLRTLERLHNPERVADALDLIRRAGIPRSSIDLIYAIPGQTLADFRRDLDAAIALNTDHLSCYNLTYEPQTAMTARLARGEFTPADENTEIDMFSEATSRLERAGLARYEISNYARPGCESQHNLAYWRQEQWIACGPSAAAHLTLANGPHRWKNTPRLDDYLARDDDGFTSAQDHEPPDPRRALVERIMTGLRLREGLHADTILAAAASLDPEAPARLSLRAEHAIAHGHIDSDAAHPPVGTPARWCLTDAGMLVHNAIARSLTRALG